MPAYLHGHSLRDTGPDHIPDGRPPEIVEELAWHARSLTGPLPGVLKALEGSGGLMEHERAPKRPGVPATLYHRVEG